MVYLGKIRVDKAANRVHGQGKTLIGKVARSMHADISFLAEMAGALHQSVVDVDARRAVGGTNVQDVPARAQHANRVALLVGSIHPRIGFGRGRLSELGNDFLDLLGREASGFIARLANRVSADEARICVEGEQDGPVNLSNVVKGHGKTRFDKVTRIRSRTRLVLPSHLDNYTSFSFMEPMAAIRQGQEIEDMLVPSCFASTDHMGRMPCYIKSFRRDPDRYDLFCQFLEKDARLAMYAALPLYFANCMREPRLDRVRRVAEILYDIDSPVFYEIICSKLSNNV